MRKKQYERVIGCMGVAVLCGMLHHPGTAAAEGLPMRTGLWPEHAMLLQDTGVSAKGLWKQFGAEYQYIEGLEWLSELVLTELPKEKAEVQEEATEAVTDSAGEEESIEQAEGELTLMQRVNTLEGTRVFANVSNFVNVRQAADTKSSVVGKLYGKCVATVLQEEADWVYVTSGNVTGYVVKEFLLLGEEAEAAIAKTYQPKIKVTANTLNVRAGAGTEYETLGSFKKGAEAELLEKGSEWMKIRYVSGNESRTGYVFAKYVEITGEPKYGETLKEEAKRLEEEKKAKEKEEAEDKIEDAFDKIEEQLEHFKPQAILLIGGDFDFPADWYVNLDKEVSNFKRHEAYQSMIKYAETNKLPVLGICGGEQALAGYLGAKIKTNINKDKENIQINHRPGGAKFVHSVHLDQNSKLFDVVKQNDFMVTSVHHEVVDKENLGNAKVVATAPDGMVEAIEPKNSWSDFVIGVQWHPERWATLNNEPSVNLFKSFIESAKQK